MKVYGLKNCDTCRKAIKQLEAAGVSFEVVDVRADGVSEEKIAGWLKHLSTEVLVNKRSTTWRGLSDTQKKQAEDINTAAKILSANPTLMKRPIIENGKDVSVGWAKAVQAEFL